MRAMVSAGCLQ